MIIKLLLAIGLIFVVFSMMNAYKRMPPQKKKAFIFKCFLFGAAGVLLLGVVSGRMHWFGAVLAAMLPMLRFGAGAATRILPFWLNRTGGVAPFKTQFLDVKVAIQRGTVTGSILKGPHAGKAIESLNDQQLTELEEHYKDLDVKSYYLIKFARRAFTSKTNGQQQAPAFGDPSRDEALQILGLSGSPTKEEIINAHRRLINRLHPDRGGSDFLAARVNQARDTLLK